MPTPPATAYVIKFVGAEAVGAQISSFDKVKSITDILIAKLITIQQKMISLTVCTCPPILIYVSPSAIYCKNYGLV